MCNSSGDVWCHEGSNTYTSRVAEIFAVILKSLGIRIEFEDDKNIVKEYDDEKLSIHVYDGLEYFCSDYDFMLVKRRKEIEKELLHKFGIIDKDELNKLIMEELKNRNFIIGPDKYEYDSVVAFEPDTIE